MDLISSVGRINMSNSELRKKAFQIYKSHWKTLTLVSFIVFLMASIIYGVGLLSNILAGLIGLVPLAGVAVFIFSTLLYPIITLGSSYVYLEAWRGKNPKFHKMFYLCASKKDWLNAILLGFIFNLIIRVVLLPTTLREFITLSYAANFILEIMSFVFGIIFIWIVLRLALAPYLYNIGHSDNPINIIKASYARMKGNVGTLIFFNISIWWWRIFAAAIPMWFYDMLRLLFGVEMQTNDMTTTLLYSGAAVLIIFLLAPYPLLAVAGYADGLIPPEKE